jgi:hypothetical protein
MQAPIGTRHIFIEFAHRDDGLPRASAAYEFDTHLAPGGHAVLRDFYVAATSRIGAPFALTRRGRTSLYLTFENAMAHAFFAAAGAEVAA